MKGTVSQILRDKLAKIGILIWWPFNVDEIMDKFREKYNIIIYHKSEPFVQPTGDEHKIMYCFAVKKCYPGEPNGWNRREYIGESKWCDNIYEAKRQAIKIALKYVETRTDCKCTR